MQFNTFTWSTYYKYIFWLPSFYNDNREIEFISIYRKKAENK